MRYASTRPSAFASAPRGNPSDFPAAPSCASCTMASSSGASLENQRSSWPGFALSVASARGATCSMASTSNRRKTSGVPLPVANRRASRRSSIDPLLGPRLGIRSLSPVAYATKSPSVELAFDHPESRATNACRSAGSRHSRSPVVSTCPAAMPSAKRLAAVQRSFRAASQLRAAASRSSRARVARSISTRRASAAAARVSAVRSAVVTRSSSRRAAASSSSTWTQAEVCAEGSARASPTSAHTTSIGIQSHRNGRARSRPRAVNAAETRCIALDTRREERNRLCARKRRETSARPCRPRRGEPSSCGEAARP